MACCPSNIIIFAGVALTSITYTPAMLAKYGPQPRVEVFYYDNAAKEFVTLNGQPASLVAFNGSTINIDHGGVASGFVKIA